LETPSYTVLGVNISPPPQKFDMHLIVNYAPAETGFGVKLNFNKNPVIIECDVPDQLMQAIECFMDFLASDVKQLAQKLEPAKEDVLELSRQVIKEFPTTKAIQSLQLSWSTISDEISQKISQLISSTNSLKSVNLCGAFLSHNSLNKILGSISSHPNITSVNLMWLDMNYMCSSTVASIISKTPNLEILNLSFTPISKKYIHEIEKEILKIENKNKILTIALQISQNAMNNFYGRFYSECEPVEDVLTVQRRISNNSRSNTCNNSSNTSSNTSSNNSSNTSSNISSNTSSTSSFNNSPNISPLNPNN